MGYSKDMASRGRQAMPPGARLVMLSVLAKHLGSAAIRPLDAVGVHRPDCFVEDSSQGRRGENVHSAGSLLCQRMIDMNLVFWYEDYGKREDKTIRGPRSGYGGLVFEQFLPASAGRSGDGTGDQVDQGHL